MSYSAWSRFRFCLFLFVVFLQVYSGDSLPIENANKTAAKTTNSFSKENPKSLKNYPGDDVEDIRKLLKSMDNLVDNSEKFNPINFEKKEKIEVTSLSANGILIDTMGQDLLTDKADKKNTLGNSTFLYKDMEIGLDHTNMQSCMDIVSMLYEARKIKAKIEIKLQKLKLRKNSLKANLKVIAKQKNIKLRLIVEKKKNVEKQIRALQETKQKIEQCEKTRDSVILVIKDLYEKLKLIHEKRKLHIKHLVNFSNIEIIQRNNEDLFNYAKEIFNRNQIMVDDVIKGLDRVLKIPNVYAMNQEKRKQEKVTVMKILQNCQESISKIEVERSIIKNSLKNVISDDIRKRVTSAVVPSRDLADAVKKLNTFLEILNASENKINNQIRQLSGELSGLVNTKKQDIENEMVLTFIDKFRKVYESSKQALMNEFDLEKGHIDEILNDASIYQKNIKNSSTQNIQVLKNDMYKISQKIENDKIILKKAQKVFASDMAFGANCYSFILEIEKILEQLDKEQELLLSDKKNQMEHEKNRFLRKCKHDAFISIIDSAEDFNDFYNRFLMQKEAICNELIGKIEETETVKGHNISYNISEMLVSELEMVSVGFERYRIKIEKIITNIRKDIFVSNEDIMNALSGKDFDIVDLISDVLESINSMINNVDSIIKYMVKTSKQNVLRDLFDYEIKSLNIEKRSFLAISENLSAQKAKISKAFNVGENYLKSNIFNVSNNYALDEQEVVKVQQKFMNKFKIFKLENIPSYNYAATLEESVKYSERLEREINVFKEHFFASDDSKIEDLHKIEMEELLLLNTQKTIAGNIINLEKFLVLLRKNMRKNIPSEIFTSTVNKYEKARSF